MRQDTQRFLSHGSVKRNMLTYSTLWHPKGWGLHSNPLKWSKDQTWVPLFLLILSIPVCEESPQLRASRGLTKWSKSKHRVREGERIHTQEKITVTYARNAKTRAQVQDNTRTTQNWRLNLSQITRMWGCEVSKCWYTLKVLGFLVGGTYGSLL
jgi:hypothetical protein